MTDRLTAETARVGMRVRCVRASHYALSSVAAGGFYTVSGVDNDGMIRLIETGNYWFCADGFIPADPQPDQSLRAILSERAPDLLAALVEWYVEGIDGPPPPPFSSDRLCDAIDRAGLLPEPSQPAPLPAMWVGADAFEGEG